MPKKIISIFIFFIFSFTFLSLSASALVIHDPKFSYIVYFDSTAPSPEEFDYAVKSLSGFDSSGYKKIIFSSYGEPVLSFYFDSIDSSSKIYLEKTPSYNYLHGSDISSSYILYGLSGYNQTTGRDVAGNDEHLQSNIDPNSIWYSCMLTSDSDYGLFKSISIGSSISEFFRFPSYDIYYSDIPIYDYETGELISDPVSYNASVTADNNYAYFNMSVDSGEFSYNFQILDSSGVSMGIDYVIGGSASPGDDFTISFDITKLRTSMEDNDQDFDSCIAKAVVTNKSTGKSDEYSCSLSGLGYLEGLFSKEKEFEPLPDINDYVDSMPPFPDLSELDWQDKVIAVIQWIGDCIGTVLHNLIGLMKWLFDTFKVLLKNLSILMYNLVVKLKRLLIELFVPDTEKIKESIKKNIPLLGQLIEAFENGYTRSSFNIHLFNQDYSFNPSDYLDSSVLSALRTVSTMIIGAMMVFHLYWLVTCILGVNSDDSGGD